MYIIWATIILTLLHTSNKYVLDGKPLQRFYIILDGEIQKYIYSGSVIRPVVYKIKDAYPYSMVRLHPIAQV